jgi:hypothetical protein
LPLVFFNYHEALQHLFDAPVDFRLDLQFFFQNFSNSTR